MTHAHRRRLLQALATPALAAALLAVHPWSSSARSAGASLSTRVIVQTLSHGAARTPGFGRRVSLSPHTSRTFVDAGMGYALGTAHGQAVPVRTTDGGRIWRIDGPGLFDVGAAQAAITVDALGTGNRFTVFAYGGSQAVDVSTDGGGTWRRAIFPGAAQAAVAEPNAGAIDVWVDLTHRTLQFATTDGGRSWHTVSGQG